MKFPAGDLFVFVFFMIGVALWSIAYYFYWSHQQLAKNGISTKGIVISLRQVKRYSYLKAPSIRYQTQDGRELIFHSSEGQNPPAYQPGEEVTLYYDPRRPEHVALAGGYLIVYVLAGIGAVFLLLSVWEIPESTVTIWKWLFSH